VDSRNEMADQRREFCGQRLRRCTPSRVGGPVWTSRETPLRFPTLPQIGACLRPLLSDHNVIPSGLTLALRRGGSPVCCEAGFGRRLGLPTSMSGEAMAAQGDRRLRPSSRRLPTSLTRRSIRGGEPMILSSEAPSSAANAVWPMSSIKLPLPCVRPVRLRPLARLRALASS
jgi:hypothetical protein